MIVAVMVVVVVVVVVVALTVYDSVVLSRTIVLMAVCSINSFNSGNIFIV